VEKQPWGPGGQDRPSSIKRVQKANGDEKKEGGGGAPGALPLNIIETEITRGGLASLHPALMFFVHPSGEEGRKKISREASLIVNRS